ncbi:Sensory box histidine kinase [Myxococcus hansupus]|uniref:histidine kinase n=1 Tax=Pseudomyxococcus hansupus TaxID=1297742 RepID=A0A0H4X9C8_9BACT|nr:ATP-binding protein [Myxococcus hansupus]AKQ70598.1 Sensory box histidine kinase [Myxococcus hansupus]
MSEPPSSRPPSSAAPARTDAFLSEASRLLAESLDWEQTLATVVRLAVREWADVALLDVVEDDGRVCLGAFATRVPAWQRELEQRPPRPGPWSRGAAWDAALKDGVARWVTVPGGPALTAHAEPPRTPDGGTPHALYLLPLRKGPRSLGLLTLSFTEPHAQDTARVREAAEDFAHRAALALANAREHREALEGLRQRDLRLASMRAFLDAAPVGMALFDQDLRCVRANPKQAALNRLPTEAHPGRTLLELLGPRAAPVEVMMREVMHTGVPVVDQLLTDAGDGERRHFRVTHFPVVAGDTRVGVGTTVTEVTEQKVEEERLRFLAEATARLSHSLDWRTTLRTAAQLLVGGKLADYCTVDVLADDGRGLERVEALASDAATQQLLHDALRFPPPPGSRSPIRHVLETGRPMLAAHIDPAWRDALSLSPEHRKLMEALGGHSAMFVPLVARGRCLGVLSVVSQDPNRRYQDRDLDFLEDLASRTALAVDNAWLYREASRAVAARDEFVAIATHELRTPLSALQLQLASLLRAVDKGLPMPPERLHQGLASTQRQAERLSHLVTHLFEVARISTGRLDVEREDVDLSALVHRLVARMEEALVAAGCAPVTHANTPVIAHVDRLRVEQVLMNLLSNAMKYAPGQPVELSVDVEAGAALVVVRDWGPGIPAGAAPRIFERFERATGEHARASLGLGLYISRQIARAHGGDLTVETPSLGPGARFVLRLPLGEVPPAPTSSP